VLRSLLDVRKRQGTIGIGNLDDLIEPCNGVTYVLRIGQGFFTLLRKGKDGIGQVALTRQPPMFLVRFPSGFHFRSPGDRAQNQLFANIEAGVLDISEGTVKTHMKSILPKLDASDRTHAVMIALKRGILEL
jgi:Bacterial regulatory proteins, luxR family